MADYRVFEISMTDTETLFITLSRFLFENLTDFSSSVNTFI